MRKGLDCVKKAVSRKELAAILGYKPSAMAYILYKIPDDKKYGEFAIAKKGGGERRIAAPTEKLKKLQRSLAMLLNDCYDEICAAKGAHRTVAHGFRRGCSIMTNAAKHRNRRHVFNVDLKDFFPTINFGRVRGFFMKDSFFQLPEDVATALAQIVCFKGCLPQGAPTSPIVSNLLGQILDVRLVRLAKQNRCCYSRYADDLTFSTNQKAFPQGIGVQDGSEKWVPGLALRKVIERAGFVMNDHKVSMCYRGSRQRVTGLIVNTKVNVCSEYYRDTRAMCHSLFMHDRFATRIAEGVMRDGSLRELEGRLSHIDHVARAERTRACQSQVNTEAQQQVQSWDGKCELYRRFLYYKNFYASSLPVLLCEGATDPIYIRCALHGLSAQYPSLISGPAGSWVLKLRFMQHSRNLTKLVMKASGTSGLGNVCWDYHKMMQKFRGGRRPPPLVVVLDRDKGKGSVIHRCKKENGWTVDDHGIILRKKESCHVVSVSPSDGEAIEDLFDTKTLNIKLDGKSFSRADDFDTSKFYGKRVFANRVIKPNIGKIDFSGFIPFLDAVREIVVDRVAPRN